MLKGAPFKGAHISVLVSCNLHVEHGSEWRDRQTVTCDDDRSLFILQQETSTHRQLSVQVCDPSGVADDHVTIRLNVTVYYQYRQTNPIVD